MFVISWSPGGQCSSKNHTYIPYRKEKLWEYLFILSGKVSQLLSGEFPMVHWPGQIVILPGGEPGKPVAFQLL